MFAQGASWGRRLSIALLLPLCACATRESTRPPPPPPTLAGAACVAALKRDRAVARPVSFGSDGECHIDTPIRVSSLGVSLSPAVTMDCGLAERLDSFIRDVVQPAAQRRFGQGVRTLTNFGVYNCRAESSGSNRVSQHGLGRAIDVSGFVLADGTRLSVEDDWDGDGAGGRFIHDVARGACEYFSVVLTPDSNADHHNHLHLDVGPERLCGPA